MFLFCRVLTFIVLVTFVTPLMAQYDMDGLTLADTSHRWFDEQIGLTGNNIILGAYERASSRAPKAHAFFGDGTWADGEIAYRGQVFQNIMMVYDIEKDLVFLLNNASAAYANFPIKINQSQIDWFNIAGHHFVQFDSAQIDRQAGIYEVLYSGQSVSFLAKRIKEKAIDGMENTYVEDHKFFIKINGSLHVISGRSSLLAHFPNEKSEMKAFLKSRGIRKMKDVSLGNFKALGVYCNELIGKE